MSPVGPAPREFSPRDALPRTEAWSGVSRERAAPSARGHVSVVKTQKVLGEEPPVSLVKTV